MGKRSLKTKGVCCVLLLCSMKMTVQSGMITKSVIMGFHLSLRYEWCRAGSSNFLEVALTPGDWQELLSSRNASSAWKDGERKRWYRKIVREGGGEILKGCSAAQIYLTLALKSSWRNFCHSHSKLPDRRSPWNLSSSLRHPHVMYWDIIS